MTADQLRKSILQQAIQGKLVAQDPNDEPASILLECIREEKERLVKEKKIKKDKNPSIIFRGDDNSHYEKFTLSGEIKCIDDEIPFEIPKGWEWTRLGDVGDWGAGATPLRSNPEFFGGLIPWLKTGELNYDVIFETEEYITEKALQECSLRLCTQGDILIAMYGATIGKLGIAGIELTTNQACCACTPILFYNMFLFYYLMASKQVFVEQGEGGAQPNISRIKLVSHLFPMPPLAEQKRIVDKIEELMPLIEQYSKAQSELEALNSNIREQLKKSILQYAIEGKLVPQSKEDGTAEELLAEIQAEKQRLYDEGKLKKKDLAHSTIFKAEDNKYYEQIGNEINCIDDEIPFEIPKGVWHWCRLRDICSVYTGATFKKEEVLIKKEGVRILRGGNILPFKIVYNPDDIFLSKSRIQKNILLKKNDIITPAVTSLENIGKMVRIESDIKDIAVGGFVFTLRLYKNIDILSTYLQYLLSSPVFIKYLKSISNKSGQAFYNIGKERLSMILLYVPNLYTQERITLNINKLFKIIEG